MKDILAATIATWFLMTPGTEHSVRKTQPVKETAAQNWYVRLTAEAPGRGMSTENAQVGQLERPDASEQNLRAFTPFGGSYLDIVIRNDKTAAELKADFHPRSTMVNDAWTFVVKSDDANATVMLSWRGLYILTPYRDAQSRIRYRETISTTNPLLNSMRIVDVKGGEAVPVTKRGEKSFITFRMGGENERVFRWEILAQSAAALGTASAQKEGGLHVHYGHTSPGSRATPKEQAFDLKAPPVFSDWQ